MHKMSNNLRFTYGKQSTSLGGESSDKIESGTFVNMENYHNVEVVANVTGVASGSVVTLYLLEATASAGTGSATISGFSDTFTSTATSDTDVLRVEARAEQLSTGYTFVGGRLSTNSSSGTEPCDMFHVQANPRYGQATLPA